MGCFSSKPDPGASSPNGSPSVPRAARQAVSQAVSPALTQPAVPANAPIVAQSKPPSVSVSPDQDQAIDEDEPTPLFVADAEDLGPQLTKIGPRAAKQGGFSEVWLATFAPDDKESFKVAIKCLRAVDVGFAEPNSKDAKERLEKRMKREMRVWLPLKHPRILECIGYAMIDQRPSLVSPWCKNGNAREYLDTHEDCDRKAMVAQVAEGLVFLHDREHPIVHYDVKLPNIMINDDGKAMLTDFGVAKVVDELKTGLTTVNPTAITLKYSSPEAVAGSDRDVMSDVYSFGCVALEIMTNKAPFYNLKTQPAIVRAKSEGKVPVPAEFPELAENDPLWNLLLNCWDMDPKKRPTMKNVLKELERQGYHAEPPATK